MKKSAFALVVERMPATLLLTFAGLIISLIIAIPLGIVSAIRRYSLIDNLCTMFAVGGQAMPIFWLGIMLIFLFAIILRWLPPSGFVSPTENLGESLRLLLMPSFTLATGKDHWEVLLRARAIENQCWVLAPAQYGRHDDGGLRRSHGHAMIVDPWGQVVARVPDGPGVAVAEVDRERVVRVRRELPALDHRRL